MGIIILTVIIAVLIFILFIHTKDKITILLFALSAVTIGALLSIFITGYFVCIAPEKVMDKKNIEISSINITEDLFFITDINRDSYDLSSIYTPIYYDTEKSYIIVNSLKDTAKFWLMSVNETYELHLMNIEQE